MLLYFKFFLSTFANQKVTSKNVGFDEYIIGAFHHELMTEGFKSPNSMA